MRLTRAAALLLTLSPLAVTGLVARASADDKPSDLVGVYEITKGEKFGIPEPADRVKGTMVRFSEDRVVVVDKESREIYGASYKIEPGREPWKITMTSKLSPSEGTVAKGLIEKDGETVRLIYALPGGEEPTGFKTKDKQLMFEMKYQKK